MPDVGDLVTATLTVSPFSGSTSATITVYKPDGTTGSASTPTTADSGATWTATFTPDAAGWWLLKWTVTGTGAGLDYQRVFVSADPVSSGVAAAYASLEKLKASLDITHSSDDDLLLDALDSASREIDQHCGRRFYADSTATARTYYADSSTCVQVDDFYETASLVVKTDSGDDGTYETTLTLNTDFYLQPLNGVVDGESGWPYRKLLATSGLVFPTSGRRPQVQVTAKWGWAAVPRPVFQACLIMARANYKMKDVAFGAAGVGDLGIVTVRQVPAALTKLAPYRRNPMLVA